MTFMFRVRTGHIREWKDKIGEGWIEPDEPIESDCVHPSGRQQLIGTFFGSAIVTITGGGLSLTTFVSL